MGTQQRREREFQRREREILDAALALFARDDWQCVTVEQIADRAEIGKGTIYKHFASKDEIYARLRMEFLDTTLGRLLAIDEQLDVLGRIRAMIAVFWEQHRQGRHYQRVVEYSERAEFRRGLNAETLAALEAREAAIDDIVHAVVRRGIAEGLFPDRPPEQLVFGPRAALIGALRLVWSGWFEDVPEPADFLGQLTDFVVAGMMYQDQLRRDAVIR
jgi:AcrR family transcriptional regulator